VGQARLHVKRKTLLITKTNRVFKGIAFVRAMACLDLQVQHLIDCLRHGSDECDPYENQPNVGTAFILSVKVGIFFIAFGMG
jgi:hypothetical protein